MGAYNVEIAGTELAGPPASPRPTPPAPPVTRRPPSGDHPWLRSYKSLRRAEGVTPAPASSKGTFLIELIN